MSIRKKIFAFSLACMMVLMTGTNVFAAEVSDLLIDKEFTYEEISMMSEEELETAGFFPLQVARIQNVPIKENLSGLISGEWGGVITSYRYVTFKVPEGKTLLLRRYLCI